MGSAHSFRSAAELGDFDEGPEFCDKLWVGDDVNHHCYLDKGHDGPCACGYCAEHLQHEQCSDD